MTKLFLTLVNSITYTENEILRKQTILTESIKNIFN